MVELSKKDWKLFQERIGDWQEAHMEKLNKEYVELLSGDEPASKKFWALEERIRSDKNTPGVRLNLRKSEAYWDLVELMRRKVISEEDLDGFSEKLKEHILIRAEYRFPEDD